MIRIRKSADRGQAEHGWLSSRHTFSFAGYRDPAHMGFRNLRVINEDRVQPGTGFGTHSHRDMEIVSYVVGGNLAHKDSLDNGSVLVAGDVQRMTAGTGVTHSEMNPSPDETAHFLQIWVLPGRDGLEPGYEEKHFSAEDKHNRLAPVISPTGRAGALNIHQDVAMFASVLDAGKELTHELVADRHAWLQVVHGGVSLNGIALVDGDGAAISDEVRLVMNADTDVEFLLFDLS